MKYFLTILTGLLLINTHAFAFGMADSEKAGVLDTLLAGTHYVAAFSTLCTSAAAGTELTGNGYARDDVTFNAASGNSKTSSIDVAFTASGAGWDNVVSLGLYDDLTGGNYVWCLNAAPNFQLLDTETHTITSGDLSVTLD